MEEDGVGVDGAVHCTIPQPNSSGETSFPYSFPSLKGGDLILSVSTPTERPSQTSPLSASPLRTSLTLTEDDDDDDEVEDDTDLENIDVDVTHFADGLSQDEQQSGPPTQDSGNDTEEAAADSKDAERQRRESEEDDGSDCKSSRTISLQSKNVKDNSSPEQLPRPPIVPPLRPRVASLKIDETGHSFGLATRSDKALTAVDMTRSTLRRDSESLSSPPPTPTTARLKASHKEEVINFLRQVISSERALRTKVAELKDERESVQVNNYRFEHILRRCVGEQAMELESVKKTIQATQQKAAEERNQRKLEEWRRQKAERHLARYRQRLMTLRQMAFSAQQYLAHAEALLTEQAVQDEIAQVSAAFPPGDRNARAIAAVHIQRRRDLWRLRQQQNGSRDVCVTGKSVTGMTADDLMISSPHESIAQKALEDIEVILDIIRRTFKIEAEMLEGDSEVSHPRVNMTDAKERACRSGYGTSGETKGTAPPYDTSFEQPPTSSTARVYRLLRKIEKEISNKSEGFKQQQQRQQQRQQQQAEAQKEDECPQVQKISPTMGPVEAARGDPADQFPPPAKSANVFPPLHPSRGLFNASVLHARPPSAPLQGDTPAIASRSPSMSPVAGGGHAARHIMSSSFSVPPKGRHLKLLSPVTPPLRATPVLRGYYNSSSMEWPQKQLREASTHSNTLYTSTSSQPSGPVIFQRLNTLTPFPPNHTGAAVQAQVSQRGSSPAVFKQPPRIMRVGLRRQVAS